MEVTPWRAQRDTGPQRAAEDLGELSCIGPPWLVSSGRAQDLRGGRGPGPGSPDGTATGAGGGGGGDGNPLSRLWAAVHSASSGDGAPGPTKPPLRQR